jgi:hypothetical protein
MGNNIESMKNKQEKPLIVMLRGHIRKSFENDKLYYFIRELMSKYNIYIYIHTWDVIQNNISWRQIEEDNTVVNETMIYKYFRECRSAIKNIIIESDSNINIFGNLIGNICNTDMPIIGWKNMWCGMNNNINKISQDIPPNIPIVNMRFDLFEVFKGTENQITRKDAIQFIDKRYKDVNSLKNFFYYNDENVGIDNIMIGNILSMYRLINHFYLNLDNIVLKYPYLKNQEFLVFRENNNL